MSGVAFILQHEIQRCYQQVQYFIYSAPKLHLVKSS